MNPQNYSAELSRRQGLVHTTRENVERAEQALEQRRAELAAAVADVDAFKAQHGPVVEPPAPAGKRKPAA